MTEGAVNSKGSVTSKHSISRQWLSLLLVKVDSITRPFNLWWRNWIGKNFREWAQSIKLMIEGKGKLSYLTSKTKKPTDAASLEKWRSENSMVTVAWLVNSMKSIGKTYLFLPSAKDVVRDKYSNVEKSSQNFKLRPYYRWSKGREGHKLIDGEDNSLARTSIWVSKKAWECFRQ